MARLTTLRPAVGLAASAVGRIEGDSKAGDRERRGTLWRAWYRTARWQRLRLRVFRRDGYVCQRTGVLLVGVDPAPDSPVAHHRRPHRGDAALFWDEANVETVAREWHDREGQREDRAG